MKRECIVCETSLDDCDCFGEMGDMRITFCEKHIGYCDNCEKVECEKVE